MPAPINRRRNGFSPPYSKPQISTWVALVLSILQFLLFITPILPMAASLPVTVVFLSLVIATVFYGGQTQLTDAIDLHLAKELQEGGDEGANAMEAAEEDEELPRKEPQILNILYDRFNPPRGEAPPDETMKQCWICDTQVASHSMHCKFCNKCVYHFDHHCMWLNTCVGEANYHMFYRCMIVIFGMELTHFAVQVPLILDMFLSFGDTEHRANAYFHAGIINGVLIFFCCFNVVSLLLIGQLLLFHINLRREKLTTYEFIVRDHKNRREKEKMENDLVALRAATIIRAGREGRTMEVMELRMGGLCRTLGCTSCDPLTKVKGQEPEEAIRDNQMAYNNNSQLPGRSSMDESITMDDFERQRTNGNLDNSITPSQDGESISFDDFERLQRKGHMQASQNDSGMMASAEEQPGTASRRYSSGPTFVTVNEEDTEEKEPDTTS